MSERAPVPSIPPLSAISDPAARAVLQALVNGWQVRNGDVGDGDERFLTLRDLKDGLTQVTRGGKGGGLQGGGDDLGGEVAKVLRGLADSISQSRLWKLLGERIERIEMPEWFRGRFGAEIRTEQIRQETASSALARQITTAVTNINGNIAIAREELSAASDLAGATAAAVTTLQTTVNSTTVTAQQALTLAQTVNGEVAGTWSVKFDANGYVTGVGLGLDGADGTYFSSFMVRADRFVIGTPSAPNVPDYMPFIVQSTSTVVNGVPVPPGVYIDAAFIKNATIDTLKIAGESILIVRPYKVAAVAAGGYGGGNVPLTFQQGSNNIIFLFSAYLPGTGVSSKVDLYINGVLGATTLLPHGDHYQSFHWSASGINEGTYTLRLEISRSGGGSYPGGTNPTDVSYTYIGNMR